MERSRLHFLIITFKLKVVGSEEKLNECLSDAAEREHCSRYFGILKINFVLIL